jgi:uncharacterized membrane protein YdfJ with MMPL/SSD domain
VLTLEEPLSYEVSSKRAVEQKLDELGVDSVRDIRRAGGARHHDIPAVLQAEQLNLRTQGSSGSMSAVIDDLLGISGHISAVRDDLHEVLAEVRQFGGRQFDGWGPIAKRMAVCVSDRAGPDAGAERALTGYLAELDALDAVLTRTAALYAETELDNAEQLRRAARADG